MAELWYPGAVKDDRGTRPNIKPVGIVLHTAVASASNLPPTGETKWNFYVNRDGKLYQYYAVNEATAAQVDGNRWYDSVNKRYEGFLALESWDGYGTSVWPKAVADRDPGSGPAWTPEQVETIIQLLVWLHNAHGVRLVKATGVQGEGVGYHSQFLRPKPQLRWTSSHACPGRKRIAQVPGIIAEAVRRTTPVKPSPTTPNPKESDVALTPAEIQSIANAVWLRDVGSTNDDAQAYLMGARVDAALARANAEDAKELVQTAIAKLDELLARGN